jgi:Amt family ammonium transporter
VVGFSIAFSFVFAMSFTTFWLIKKTIGLRVSEEEEDAGLDISEHGMYGYPGAVHPRSGARWRGVQPAAGPWRRRRLGGPSPKEVPA